MDTKVVVSEIKIGLDLSLEETVKLQKYIAQSLEMKSILDSVVDQDSIEFAEELSMNLIKTLNEIG